MGSGVFTACSLPQTRPGLSQSLTTCCGYLGAGIGKVCTWKHKKDSEQQKVPLRIRHFSPWWLNKYIPIYLDMKYKNHSISFGVDAELIFFQNLSETEK